jgi:hypothetical protein
MHVCNVSDDHPRKNLKECNGFVSKEMIWTLISSAGCSGKGFNMLRGVLLGKLEIMAMGVLIPYQINSFQKLSKPRWQCPKRQAHVNLCNQAKLLELGSMLAGR